MASRPPLVLVTNDDGIDSPFLAALVQALLADGLEVAVAAPAREQSWIGKAMSRHRPVPVTPRPDLPVRAWACDGTPSDCINLALGHLLGVRPAAVASGINIGQNAGLPFIVGSGTVGGALEGALHGLPSLAFSQQLAVEDFEALRTGGLAATRSELRAALPVSAAAAAAAVRRLLAAPGAGDYAVVHNYNFPCPHATGAPIEATVPAPAGAGSLFAPSAPPRADGSVSYSFAFGFGHEHDSGQRTDRQALRAGSISYTRLDFNRLGSPP